MIKTNDKKATWNSVKLKKQKKQTEKMDSEETMCELHVLS